MLVWFKSKLITNLNRNQYRMIIFGKWVKLLKTNLPGIPFLQIGWPYQN